MRVEVKQNSMESIENRLRKLKTNEARLRVLVSMYNEIIMDEPLDIEGEVLKSTLSGENIGRVQSAFSSTERVAMRDWMLDDVSRARLDEIRKEGQYLSLEVERVRAALDGLHERDRFVVERFYVAGMLWREVLREFSVNFGIEISESTAKRCRYDGIAAMARLLE